MSQMDGQPTMMLEPILNSLNKHWQFGVFGSNLAIDTVGQGPASVVFIDRGGNEKELVFKGLKPNRAAHETESFRREAQVLSLMAEEIKKTGKSAKELLGVSVPEMIEPEVKSERDMFVMTKLSGKLLKENAGLTKESWFAPSFASQMGEFYIKFDRLMSGKLKEKQGAQWPVKPPVMIALALQESPSPRVIHDDLGWHNVLADSGTKEIKMIDFGAVHLMDPDHVFARALSQALVGNPELVEGVIKEIQKTNEGTGDSWGVTMERACALAPLHALNKICERMNKAGCEAAVDLPDDEKQETKKNPCANLRFGRKTQRSKNLVIWRSDVSKKIM